MTPQQRAFAHRALAAARELLARLRQTALATLRGPAAQHMRDRWTDQATPRLRRAWQAATVATTPVRVALAPHLRRARAAAGPHLAVARTRMAPHVRSARAHAHAMFHDSAFPLLGAAAAAVVTALVVFVVATTEAPSGPLTTLQTGPAPVGTPSPAPVPEDGPRRLAYELLPAWDKSKDAWACLDALWTAVSDFDPQRSNIVTGAYGIPQAIPADIMSETGADWKTNPATQITWGLDYITDRHGSVCAAWDHFSARGWY